MSASLFGNYLVAYGQWVSTVHVQWEWLNIKMATASGRCANIQLQKIHLLNYILCCAISLIQCVPDCRQIPSDRLSCNTVLANLNGQWLSRIMTNGGLSSRLFLQSCTSTSSDCCSLYWDTIGIISRPFYCIYTAELNLKTMADNKPQPVWRKGRHFLSWPLLRALHAMETDRRRMLHSGPVSARCHGSWGDRADVIRMGVPWLPWRQSVNAVRILWLPRYTKTEHTP